MVVPLHMVLDLEIKPDSKGALRIYIRIRTIKLTVSELVDVHVGGVTKLQMNFLLGPMELVIKTAVNSISAIANGIKIPFIDQIPFVKLDKTHISFQDGYVDI